MRPIDADALLEELEKMRFPGAPYVDAGVEIAIGKVCEAPTIETERKKGKWTDDNACPFCGFQPWYERDIHTLSYCPNCGADMRGEQDETD